MIIKQGKRLGRYSYYKIGGLANYFAEVENLSDLREVLAQWEEICHNSGLNKEEILILGEGSNLLFSDGVFPGLVIRNRILNFEPDQSDGIKVGSGYLMRNLALETAKRGLSGLEWAGGLPGTIGGAVRGNAGAFGGEMKDSISAVLSFNLFSGELLRRNKEECQFGYRESIFKVSTQQEFIFDIRLQLTKADKELVLGKTRERINYRLNKHPMAYPSLGCMFKNVPLEKFSEDQKKALSKKVKNDPFLVIPAAVLIDQTGLKGKRIGGAEISEKHANFFVNLGGAKAEEVKELLSLAKEKVKRKYGISLEEEIIVI